MVVEISNIETLDKVITESGLVLSDAEQIKMSYLPFFNQLSEIKKESMKINFENPTKEDELLSRELRLRTVKVRTGCNDIKDERKKIHLLRGNLEQSAYNLIKSTCMLDEEKFVQVEKRSENLEKARKEELKAKRIEHLLPYCEIAATLPLGEMDEAAYRNMYDGYKLAHEARVAAEKKAEEERVANEKKQKLFNERKLQVAEYQQFYSIELHEPLTIESTEEQFTALVDSLRDLKKTHDANQEKIRIENERLKKEADQKEKERLAEKEKQDAILKSEREKADALLESQRKQAAKEKAIADAKLKAANEENERLKRIEKEKQDAADKAERERIAAEKKAAKAPDKDKLTAWLESIKMNDIPTGLGNDAGTVGLTISNKFDSFKVWAKTQIENL
ncbi:MAG TPA: hypothetical protein PLN38_08255 [Chitinophagales bacterium]|nr:hypothetical protein [Chitinophagales bacterium]